MPKDYMEWKKAAGTQMRSQMLELREPLSGRMSIAIRFMTASGNMRCDLDNACGAVFDALQDAKIIANDRDIKSMQAEIMAAEDVDPPHIEITLIAV